MNRNTKPTPIADCHASGIFSIPLRHYRIGVDDKPRLVRTFIDTKGNAGQVAPHSHAYPLQITVTHGTLVHTIWREDDMGPHERWVMHFASPIKDESYKHVHDDSDGSESIEPARFIHGDGTSKHYKPSKDRRRYITETETLEEGGQVTLTSDQIHSLTTEPGTSWIVCEYEDDNDHPIVLAPTEDYQPDLTGLYRPIP